MNINQVLIIDELSINNEKHNMGNIISNAQGCITDMFLGIRETNNYGCI